MDRDLDQSLLIVDARYEMLFQLGVKSNKAQWMAYMATVLAHPPKACTPPSLQ